jgi:hypothetical protein
MTTFTIDTKALNAFSQKQRSVAGQAVASLLRRKVTAGRVATNCGPKTDVGLTVCLIDLCEQVTDKDGNVTANADVLGKKIATLFSMRRKSNQRFDIMYGDKTYTGLALTVIRALTDVDFQIKIINDAS